MRLLSVISLLLLPLLLGGLAFGDHTPSHLFVLYSYGRSYAPDRSHTFAFFAKMSDGESLRIEEHFPISWLPVVTKPRQDPDGEPILAKDGTLQIAPVEAGRVNRGRLGWNYSIKKTLLHRKKMPGITTVKTHGAFVISQEQYDTAKRLRLEMLSNVESVMRGLPRDPDKYYYRAINQSLFFCPNGQFSGQLNCFQAVLAAFGICETSGPLSGVSVTDYILARLREKHLIGEKYLDTAEDVEPLLVQILDREKDGDFDTPLMP